MARARFSAERVRRWSARRPRAARRVLALASLLVATLAVAPSARAQLVPGRVMVIFDTSGSMLGRLDNNNNTGGDSDTFGSYRDGNTGPNAWYQGTNGNGRFSRLYAGKKALTAAVNAAPSIDFGLARFALNSNAGVCPDARNCCTFGAPRCIQSQFYTNTNGNGSGRINFTGDCGPVSNNQATDGGQVLVLPGAVNGARSVFSWVDGVEDFRNRGDGWPNNPELRGDGLTPLAGSMRTVLNRWYRPIYDVSKAGAPGFDPGNAQYDPKLDCRPYSVVLMTDGADTCEGNGAPRTTNPPLVAQQIYGANGANPVKTYVIGLAFVNGDPAMTVLNNVAMNGGTRVARFANTQTDIEAAFADIVNESVKYEVCNNRDDNCNAVVDEGFDKGVACKVGTGPCERAGIRKCDALDSSATTCCVDDGMPNGACVQLTAGPPAAELCNQIDDDCNGLIDDGIQCMPCSPMPEVCDGKDNDCDGVIDNDLVNVGFPCGLALGRCVPGQTVCVPGAGKRFPDPSDTLQCVGGQGPIPEACNGIDDDCDGVIDSVARACYTGPAGTDGVGPCLGGEQACTAVPGSGVARWGACVGEYPPSQELCNGIDDDCDGTVDDLPNTGGPCCPSGKCGIGRCKPGVLTCQPGGGTVCIGDVGPIPETCNGEDDDCNRKVDDLAGLGRACVPQGGGCAGTLVCDVMLRMVVCSSNGMGGREVCNGVDDDCDMLIDEPAEVAANDARIGKPCGNDMNLPLPCSPGATICKGGQVVCQGASGPRAEACDCADNDCNGKVNDNAPCGAGRLCHKCGCYEPCGGGEFRCPGGYECDADNFCVPLLTCQPACPDEQLCVRGACVDPCADIVCPATYVCKAGRCVGVSCVELDNCKRCDAGGGERCDRMNRACVADRCCGANCGAGSWCDPVDGRCVKNCTDVRCDAGRKCVLGECVVNLCAEVRCIAGQACDAATGKCVGNPCYGRRCVAGYVCAKGECLEDPCATFTCPPGQRCGVDLLTGRVGCDQQVVTEARRDEVAAAGGSGFGLGCSVTRGRGGGSLPLLALLLVFGVRVSRGSRRARARGPRGS